MASGVKSKGKRPIEAEPVRLSAKTLGALAMPGFCPRCFWIESNLEGRPPYQTPFPGIFSTLDSYGKRLVTGWFERHGSAPAWLAGLGEIRRTIAPPHFSKFFALDPETGIVLRGTPDAIFEMGDGSHAIIDYKTAKFTATQDELFPMYEAQLNAYAHIGDRTGLRPVSQLALVYTEPVADDAANNDANLTPAGFELSFSARILPVEIKASLVPRLLKKAKAIFDLPAPPRGLAGCEDCAALEALVRVARS